MNPAPDSYKEGIFFVENLDSITMKMWLIEELTERSHALAGRGDDFPVQAIMNYYPFLNSETQERLREALTSILDCWKNRRLVDWPFDATRALLNLIREIPVLEARSTLFLLVGSKSDLQKWSRALKYGILSAISGVSNKDDIDFWKRIAGDEPEFGGFCFQVIQRLDPQAALSFVHTLDFRIEAVYGGVERAIDPLELHEYLALYHPAS